MGGAERLVRAMDEHLKTPAVEVIGHLYYMHVGQEC